jgi:F-type H+-transporting ATPase subunit delta
VSVQAQPKDYAAAIYDLAFETWSQQLGNIQKSLRADPSLRAAIEDPAKSTQDKLASLAQAVPGGLNADVRRFLGTLLEAGQFAQLDAILAEFDRMVRRRPERNVAQVVTAVPLTDAERGLLRAQLTERFGPDLEFQFEVDPSLIGGVYLRVGDKVIDGSVAGKLATLRERLAA